LLLTPVTLTSIHFRLEPLTGARVPTLAHASLHPQL